MNSANNNLQIYSQNSWNGPITPTSIGAMRGFLRKHNALLALVLSLVLVVGGSLQLIHDQLLDHQHTSECAAYMVDGKLPLGQSPAACEASKQAQQSTPYSPIKIAFSLLTNQQPRAPPAK